jgi:hypothetical protein
MNAMAPAIQLRFYEELNDCLPAENRKRAFAVDFEQGATVADLLGRIPVPVEKVDLILCNGVSVGLSQALQDGDRVSVYPVFESLDIAALVRLREKPLRVPRFLAGPSLPGLARLLSARGFDARVEDAEPPGLCRIAEEEGRILLIEGNLPPGAVLPSRICRVVSSEADEQLDEVLARLDLAT